MLGGLLAGGRGGGGGEAVLGDQHPLMAVRHRPGGDRRPARGIDQGCRQADGRQQAGQAREQPHCGRLGPQLPRSAHLRLDRAARPPIPRRAAPAGNVRGYRV